MALNIATRKQTNLWGKQSDIAGDIGLEPQRNDLYYVDFDNALKNVAVISKQSLAPLIPQYVRSCSLPELRTKSEPIRRDSVAYNMPSWDDPLDPVKLVFMMETSSYRSSRVTAFLDAWLVLTRAGRGSRVAGYYEPTGWLTLNSNFSIDFRFDVNLYLLRGSFPSSDFSQSSSTTISPSTTSVTPSPVLITSTANQLNATLGASVNFQSGGLNSNMVLHTTYVLKNAWLGAYKVSDFNYAESNLTTVEATFYIDSYDVQDGSASEGLPPNIDDSNR